MHHVVSDAWSVSILVRELAALYSAFLQRRPSPLPDLPLQYADFAAWQRRALSAEHLERLLLYWKKQLAGLTPLPLPSDRPRPRLSSQSGATAHFLVPRPLLDSLKTLARAHGVTLFMTLLAAFKALLYRYCAHEDLAVGTAVAGRNRIETEPLIGFFVNMLVLRTRVQPDAPFTTLLHDVRNVVLDAFAHQDLPFEKLVQEIQPERDLDRRLSSRSSSSCRTPPPRPSSSATSASLCSTPAPARPVRPHSLDARRTKRPLRALVLPARPLRPGHHRSHARQPGSGAARGRHATGRTAVPHRRPSPGRRAGALASPGGAPGDEPREAQGRPTPSGRSASRRSGPSSLIESDTSQHSMPDEKHDAFQRFMALRRRAVKLSNEELVTTGPLADGGSLPLVVQPALDHVQLEAWTRSNRERVEAELLEHGALLFRGFGVASAAAFERCARALCPDLLDYRERAAPRSEIGRNVYTSTEYPADYHIPLHHEMSYSHNWPTKIWFCCLQPPSEGGRTPIASDRVVFERLDQAVKKRFVRHGVMYVRNYGEGVDLPWQDAFQTTERAVVEEYCRRSGTQLEWKEDGRLRTRQVRQAVAVHPRTGHTVWFNHAHLFHSSSLEPEVRAALRSEFAEDELPRNAFYGDGSPMEDSVLDHIRHVYQEAAVAFTWARETSCSSTTSSPRMAASLSAAHGRLPWPWPSSTRARTCGDGRDRRSRDDRGVPALATAEAPLASAAGWPLGALPGGRRDRRPHRGRSAARRPGLDRRAPRDPAHDVPTGPRDASSRSRSSAARRRFHTASTTSAGSARRSRSVPSSP